MPTRKQNRRITEENLKVLQEIQIGQPKSVVVVEK